MSCLHSTLLDGASHELQSRRWADITMADIALAAGVSRQTLYKEFGSRDEFAQVLVLREAARFLDAVEQAVTPISTTPPRHWLRLSTFSSRPPRRTRIVRTIVGGEGAEELLALFTTQGKPLVESAVERITAVMLAGWPFVKAPMRNCSASRWCAWRSATRRFPKDPPA